MMKNLCILVILVVAVLPSQSFADISCRVIGITDGDTLTCLQGKQQIKVRLSQIDAPESKQDFGEVSRQSLANLVFGKNVVLKNTSQDRYGRTLAEIFLGSSNINKLQVQNGMAWAYREYLSNQDYLILEGSARQQRLGLWSQSNPIYPQDFRRNKKGTSYKSSSSNIKYGTKDTYKVNNRAIISNPNSNGGFSACGTKTVCGQMSSCAEANYFLNTCGLTRLDRDKDGVPCESICR